MNNPQYIESTIRAKTEIPPDERAQELIVGDDSHNDPDEDLRLGPSESAPEAAPSWRVAKALLILRDEVNRKAPNRNKSSDGTIGDARHCDGGGTSDHCARIRDAGVGVVTAIDITHDVVNGCNAEVIADTIRGRQDPRVKYIIWNRRIANSAPIGGQPAWAWRPYTGSNPHDKHVHISVKSIKEGQSGYDSSTPWGI